MEADVEALLINEAEDFGGNTAHNAVVDATAGAGAGAGKALGAVFKIVSKRTGGGEANATA